MTPITLKRPTDTDGSPVFELIKQCPPLDMNSTYCNLLQCSHFSDTSVIARRGIEVVGFISGYIIPGQSDTLFVWQVAVSSKVRGRGLAKDMLKHIITRDECKDVTYLETSITSENNASWALFKSFAQSYSAHLTQSEMFNKERHFAGAHETEHLVRIGPFKHSHKLTTHA